MKKEGVFVFRNLDDTRALLERARPGLKAVVIGGGLLGLEAARGLQVQGCDVTVVHLTPTLMDKQLDLTGGAYLKNKMERLGVRVLCANQRAHSGQRPCGRVEFKGREHPRGTGGHCRGHPTECGAGRKAGLEIKRGIVVNDHMETSNPEHFRGRRMRGAQRNRYGLVAPLFEQGKVLAATITGNKGPEYEGRPAAKLKIMGVDVFSAGDFTRDAGTEVVRYEDASLGVYKKLTFENKALWSDSGGRNFRQPPLHGVAAHRN